MKNILKKGSKFFLTALVILNSLMNTLPVHAEETTTDENDLDTIVELGNAEDVLDLYNSKNPSTVFGGGYKLKIIICSGMIRSIIIIKKFVSLNKGL